VLEPRFNVRAIPVQEYLPNSLYVLWFEALFLFWTAIQLLGEFVECYNLIRAGYQSDGGRAIVILCHNYFANLFNALDWTRFSLIGLSIWMRIDIINDKSRDFDPTTTTFIDTEQIVLKYVSYDIVSCIVMVLCVLSTIQYFDLMPTMAILKSTLAVCAVQLGPFMFVFLFFFLFYALIGSLLVGPNLEEWSVFNRATFTTFEMMNGNYKFDNFLPALASGGLVKTVVMIFYFISFIMLHYFMLLNVIIAIVVEAYLEVRKHADAVTNVMLDQNTDTLSHHVGERVKELGLISYYTTLSFVLPASFKEEAKTAFVKWTDAEWHGILKAVMEYRYALGKEIKQVALCELAYDITRVEKGAFTLNYMQTILHHDTPLADLFVPAEDDTDPSGRFVRETSFAKPKAAPMGSVVPVGIVRPTKATLTTIVAEKNHGKPVALDSTTRDDHPEASYCFRQCLTRFYDRPYFTAPPNPREPLDEAAQPSASTWLDRMLRRMEDKVGNIDDFINTVKEEAKAKQLVERLGTLGPVSNPMSVTMEDFVKPKVTGAKTPASQLAKVTSAQSHHPPGDGATNGAASSANGLPESPAQAILEKAKKKQVKFTAPPVTPAHCEKPDASSQQANPGRAEEQEQLGKLAAPPAPAVIAAPPSHRIGASDSNSISLMVQAQQESINAIFRQNIDLREQVARLERAQQYEKENTTLRERVARLEAEATAKKNKRDAKMAARV